MVIRKGKRYEPRLRRSGIIMSTKTPGTSHVRKLHRRPELHLHGRDCLPPLLLSSRQVSSLAGYSGSMICTNLTEPDGAVRVSHPCKSYRCSTSQCVHLGRRCHSKRVGILPQRARSQKLGSFGSESVEQRPGDSGQVQRGHDAGDQLGGRRSHWSANGFLRSSLDLSSH